MRKVYSVLPVYNEGESIYNLLKSYGDVQNRHHIDFKIIVINDFSKDQSEDYIKQAMKDFVNLDITYINHETNKGLHGSLYTGFKHIKDLIKDDDVLITMDGDNTHNPFLIPSMISKIDEGASIIIASRYLEQSRIFGLSRFRIFLSLGARCLYKVIWQLDGVNDYTCNYRAYRGGLFNKFYNQYKENIIVEQGFTAVCEVLKKMYQIEPYVCEVPMILKYSNKLEESNMKILKTIQQTLKILFKTK